MTSAENLASALGQSSPPQYGKLLETFSHEDIWNVVRVQPASKRIALAQLWCSTEGLPPATAKDADSAIRRLAGPSMARQMKKSPSISNIRSPRAEMRRRRPKRPRSPAQLFPPSPSKHTPQKRRGAARRQPTDDKAITQLRRHAQKCLLSDTDPEPLFGLASLRKLQEALTRCPKQLLQQLCDITGHRSKSPVDTMKMDLVAWACQYGQATSPADSSQRAEPTLSASHQPHSGAGATSESDSDSGDISSSDVDQNDSSSGDSSSSDDSIDSRDNFRVRNFAEPTARNPASASAKEGELFVKGAIAHLTGKKARSGTVQRVLRNLQEAAQTKEVRIGVERFVAAMALHATQKAPRGLTVKSGKFFGEHKPVSVRDTGSPWSGIEVSYNFAEESSVLADSAIDELVSGITVSKTTVNIILNSQLLKKIHSAPSVYGWAELASGAGAAAMETIWKPLLSWTTPYGSPDELQADIYRKTAKVVSNLAAEIDICSEIGLRRATSALVITLLATHALIIARQTNEDTWRDSVREWVNDLRSKAKLDLLLSPQARASYTLNALAERSGGASGDVDKITGHAPQAKQPHKDPGPDKTSLQSPRSLHGGRPREFADEPDKFVWCSVCNRPSHCLWDCRFVLNRIRQRMKQGTSAQKAADFWIQKTKDRYAAKGQAFVDAFAARPDKTRAAILDKLAA